MAYNIIFILLLILSIIEKRNLLGNRIVPIFISFIFVLVFSSLRGNVGQDIPNYKDIYDNIFMNKDILEIGFYYFTYAIKFLDLDFNWFLFFSALLSLSFYYYGLIKFLNTGFVILAFMLIFCDTYMYFNMSGIRQGIALSMILLSAYYAYKKSTLKFIILIFSAVLFHKSAIVGLLIYPIINVNVKFNAKNLTLLFLCIGAWLFVLPYIMNNFLMNSNIKGTTMYLSESYNEFSLSAYIIGIIRRIYPLLLILIFRKNIERSHLIKGITNVYLLGFIIYLINYPVLQDITVRLSSYFLLFEAIIIVTILKNIQSKFNLYFIYSLVFIFIYLKLMNYANISTYHYHFYEPIFY
ncbi:EpsG family protein [Providencia sp. PROV266]|uniref:EpsG family protein n=1 Tax=Providencia sp. PROV266 TaxID=2949954 RepID=UPI00234970BD|nr:EpsG family protein [Providencia sp. PROV266]